MIEYEAKVLDVDPADIRARVLAAGGLLVRSGLQRRYVYDIAPGDPSRWIRLRTNGVTTTLAVKVIRHDGIDGTDEEEVTVNDFESAHRLLQLQGFEAKAYQENRRTSMKLRGAQIEIDEWPMIPAYAEIEGESEDHVRRAAARLGFVAEDLTSENTTKIYARYGYDLALFHSLRFTS